MLLRQQISFEVAVVASPILVWAQQFCDSVSVTFLSLVGMLPRLMGSVIATVEKKA